jgi:hypothetical protein
MCFYYYSINDPKKEPIVKHNFDSYFEALEYFSALKKFSPSQFLQIFEIGSYDE